MNSFRQINRRALLLWSLLLSLALLSAHVVKLHVHDLEHGHLSKAHFAHDTSHEHHDRTISEVDTSPNGVLKNTSNSVFALALFTLFLTLMTFIPSQQLVQCCRENKLTLHSYYLLSPPLRAPPQY